MPDPYARSQALKWHPDKNRDDPEKAGERFKSISEAYEVRACVTSAADSAHAFREAARLDIRGVVGGLTWNILHICHWF